MLFHCEIPFILPSFSLLRDKHLAKFRSVAGFLLCLGFQNPLDEDVAASLSPAAASSSPMLQHKAQLSKYHCPTALGCVLLTISGKLEADKDLYYFTSTIITT